MESKPSHSNIGVLSEDKVSLESEVQQQDLKRTDIGGSGLMISGITNVAGCRTTVQETDYATTATAVSKEEIIVTDATPANISKPPSSESGVSASFTVPVQQSSSDSLTTDRKLATQSQNPSAPIGKKENPKPDDGPVNPTEKPNADGVKTVKRENSKGWF